MKLIMENWKRFLSEERQRPPVDPRLLPALAQDAMEAGLQSIMQGAAEFAADQAPPPGGGQWASPDVSDEDTLEERGLGLGEPRDTPDGDGFGDHDDGYYPERPVPKSWVDGKPPKPPAKKG